MEVVAGIRREVEDEHGDRHPGNRCELGACDPIPHALRS
jgi:hypothetical protein